MNGAYSASLLPLDTSYIDQNEFFEELIDATAKLEVYKEKSRTVNLIVRGSCQRFSKKRPLLRPPWKELKLLSMAF